MTDILLSQLTDPFRIALIVGLVVTMLRTEAVTGRFVPLAAGVVFVAVIIPTTMNPGGTAFPQAVGFGLIANVIMLAVVLGVWSLVQRFRN